MTADPTPIPAAPTPRTPEQTAAILGANAVQKYDDEDSIACIWAMGQVNRVRDCPCLACRRAVRGVEFCRANDNAAMALLTPDDPYIRPEYDRDAAADLRGVTNA